MSTNPNNIKQAVEHLRQLRKMGYAVVAFTPEELRGADPDNVEDRLVELGWDVIAVMATDPDQDNPTEEDWNWAIK
jgi:predicted fused transcriptional regulator/phosphomethylpyrimidine kinase